MLIWSVLFVRNYTCVSLKLLKWFILFYCKGLSTFEVVWIITGIRVYIQGIGDFNDEIWKVLVSWE